MKNEIAYYQERDRVVARIITSLAFIGGAVIGLVGIWGLHAFALFCTTL